MVGDDKYSSTRVNLNDIKACKRITCQFNSTGSINDRENLHLKTFLPRIMIGQFSSMWESHNSFGNSYFV